MNNLYNSLNRNKEPYDERMVRRSIILIRISKNKKLQENSKNYIYNCLSNIIVKNVNNFFNLIKDIEDCRLVHEKDDVVIECYCILDKCIKKFNISKETKFFFYFNKALSQGLYRMVNRHYRKGFPVNYEKVNNFEDKFHTNNDFEKIELNNYQFTEQENLLIESRLREERIEEFVEKNNIQKNTYYNLLKSVREKLNKHHGRDIKRNIR